MLSAFGTASTSKEQVYRSEVMRLVTDLTYVSVAVPGALAKLAEPNSRTKPLAIERHPSLRSK